MFTIALLMYLWYYINNLFERKILYRIYGNDMYINLELYKIFYYVAKNKNITKTSKEILISQPSISKAIKSLEEQIGCQLFIRSKYGVTLTEEGKVFYDQIKTAMETIENAEIKLRELINLEDGVLNIGISHTLTQKYLMPYLKKFHSIYPKIKIRVVTGPTQTLISQARNGNVDFIILNLPYIIPSDFNIKKLKRISDGFFATEAFKNLKNKTIDLKDINSYPIILISKGSNTRYFLDNFTSSREININPEIELASYSLVYEFTKLGLGIGYLTKEFLKEELENGILFEVKTNPRIPSREIGLIHCDNKMLSNASKKFIEILNKER